MATEIERKFLLQDDSWREHVSKSQPMRQGYLASNNVSSIRVRVAGENAYLNIKSATKGLSRTEYQYAIPVADGQEMLDTLCQAPLIEKTRHYVDFAGRTWEIDVFTGANKGLIVAEVELDAVDETVELPLWIGKEVTDDIRYYNASLARKPYQKW